ncbi:hypothetical protein CK203_112221 [Vitis vinifera]|uniref:Uncharacterized protein n=1 Tax=Vitis vinifera TaxID=29760 RepID=A0A438CAZ2_VITVI|nr:hypothetical protein CK203_112221 [Vitis vinifera]
MSETQKLSFHQRALWAMDTKWGQASLGRDEGEVLAHGNKCNVLVSSGVSLNLWGEFVRSELNLVDPLTKPLSKKLAEETSRGGLLPITEVKSGGNPTY